MVRYRENNNDLKPAVPFALLYDAAGLQTFTSAGAFHTWDTIKTKSSHFNYTADDDRIQLKVNSSGLFKITFDCSFSTATANQNSTTSQIYKNGTALSGSKSVVCIYYAGGQTSPICGTQTIHYVVFLAIDDYIQIKSTTGASGNVVSAPDTSRLMIEFIPMRGYDNNMSGRESFAGKVER